jgi:hypothetical protein
MIAIFFISAKITLIFNAARVALREAVSSGFDPSPVLRQAFAGNVSWTVRGLTPTGIQP